jgi:hypothetical protein
VPEHGGAFSFGGSGGAALPALLFAVLRALSARLVTAPDVSLEEPTKSALGERGVDLG